MTLLRNPRFSSALLFLATALTSSSMGEEFVAGFPKGLSKSNHIDAGICGENTATLVEDFLKLQELKSPQLAFCSSYVLAQKMNLDQIHESLAELEKGKPSFRQNSLYLGLVERWSELDFEGAWEYSWKSLGIQKDMLILSSLRGLAQSNPELAWETFLKLPQGGHDPNITALPVLQIIATVDAPKALEYYGMMKGQPEFLEDAIMGIIQAVNDPADYAQLAIQAKGLESHIHAKTAESMLWMYAGYFDPYNAMEELKRMGKSGFDTQNQTSSLFAGWGNADGTSALQYIYDNLTEKERIKFAPIVMGQWAMKGEASSILEHLNTIPKNHLSDRSILGLAETMVKIDPQSAMEWIASIESPVLKEKAYTNSIWIWARDDADATEIFVESIQDADLRSNLAWTSLRSITTSGFLREKDLCLIRFRKTDKLKENLLESVIQDIATPKLADTNFTMIPILAKEVTKAEYLGESEKINLLKALGLSQTEINKRL